MTRYACDIDCILRVLTLRNRQFDNRDEEYVKRLYEFMQIIWKDGCLQKKDVIKEQLERICKLHL